jgi:hypothetical protein
LASEVAAPHVSPVASDDPDRSPETTPADPDAILRAEPAPRLSPQDEVDFILHPTELAKGRRAAENYLSSFRSEDSRKSAEEALETLATVISGGKCDSLDFPWQQVRPYHGAAALTILKEKGAPARIETLRCRRDSTRSYRVVPEAYPPRQVQKIRSTLSKVIEEATELGFVPEDEPKKAEAPGRKKKARRSTTSRARLLGDGELRALVAASAADGTVEGRRDAVFFSLVHRGLKIAEITALTLESVRFSNRTGLCTIVAKPARSGGRGRRVELSNDELIVLEDWLENRGDDAGVLLCTVGRAGHIEGKRLTTAKLKTICETRAQAAEVQPFTPNDLSRSAEALADHRKSVRRRAARQAADSMSEAEQALYLSSSAAEQEDEQGETIQFPFLGLDI